MTWRYDPVRRTHRDRALRAVNSPKPRTDAVVSALCLVAGLVLGLASYWLHLWVVRHP